MQPYVIKSISSTDAETGVTTYLEQTEPVQLRRVIKPETSAQVRQLLQSVVENGSGSNAQIPGYTVGGKTGTAQKYDENGNVSSTLLIASFIGFVPADDPQLICLILVDEPSVPVIYGSTVAAPFVQRALANLVQYYSIRRTRRRTSSWSRCPTSWARRPSGRPTCSSARASRRRSTPSRRSRRS